ncbi:exonuclease SbcCD subunit D [Rhodobacteraceae bacterium RKSG542]|uniref:exonuclease SbcCD subunit D n=1 Tax=Pseudovibrio flavus TaxID=2529854 RepID=UPI0012BB7344|nr:exonuclease SbcCD subunit D [Pseudovibrio flavus]MTI19102.1 exonuclease SbcCD subunit D [Pseudovibrio flavus]
MAVRILHTADWHIGQTINGWDRTFEHAFFFKELKEIVVREAVDAVLISGDVFDNQNPSAEGMRMLFHALADLRRARPHLTTVMTAGNHDPAGRLEAPGILLEEIGVSAVGMILQKDGGLDLSRHLVPLKNAEGVIEAYCLALPFPRASDLPTLTGESAKEAGSPIVRAVADLYQRAVSGAREQIGDAPLVAMGHLHVSGGDESEASERRILIGGEHAVPATVFDESLAYVALGHLHKPQRVGRDTVRYSGSPFPLSVSELNYKHGVDIIELDGDSYSYERHALTRPVPFYRLKGKDGLLVAEVEGALEALELDADLPVEQQPFVHVDLRRQTSALGLRAEVDQILSRYPVRDTGVSIVSAKEEGQAAPSEIVSLKKLEEIKPLDLFYTAFEKEHGEGPEARHLELFHSVLAEID